MEHPKSIEHRSLFETFSGTRHFINAALARNQEHMGRTSDVGGVLGFLWNDFMLSIPLRCIVSLDETHKEGGDVRRRRGRRLCGMRYDCLSHVEKKMLRRFTMMAVSYETGVIHCETTPTPMSQTSDDWLIYPAGLRPRMNKFVPGLP